MRYERLQPLPEVAKMLEQSISDLRRALDRNPKIVACSLDGFIYLTQSQIEKLRREEK